MKRPSCQRLQESMKVFTGLDIMLLTEGMLAALDLMIGQVGITILCLSGIGDVHDAVRRAMKKKGGTIIAANLLIRIHRQHILGIDSAEFHGKAPKNFGKIPGIKLIGHHGAFSGIIRDAQSGIEEHEAADLSCPEIFGYHGGDKSALGAAKKRHIGHVGVCSHSLKDGFQVLLLGQHTHIDCPAIASSAQTAATEIKGESEKPHLCDELGIGYDGGLIGQKTMAEDHNRHSFVRIPINPSANGQSIPYALKCLRMSLHMLSVLPTTDLNPYIIQRCIPPDVLSVFTQNSDEAHIQSAYETPPQPSG